MSCPNNPILPTTVAVCGTFSEPTNPDQGQCSPYREKRSCERPALPVITCADDEYVVIANPSSTTQPFKVSSRLFDQNCAVITDEDGEDILTYVA